MKAYCRDGALGVPHEPPFDRIVLTVSAEDIAPAWREQLVPGGMLVMPLALRCHMQLSIAFVKRDTFLESRSMEHCGFISLRGSLAGEVKDTALDDSEGVVVRTPADMTLPDTGNLRNWLREKSRSRVSNSGTGSGGGLLPCVACLP